MSYRDPLDPRRLETRLRHYRKNKQAYINRASRSREEVKSRMRKYKTENPCMDCGNFFHFSAMDFDHRPGELKRFQIGSEFSTWARTLAEIAKCDLVCANCHRVRTWKRLQVGGVAEAPLSPKQLA